MGNKIRRFISTLLALTVAFTSIPLSPITAYAVNKEGTLENSAGQKDGNATVTTGGDWSNDLGGNQGLRISLVSANDPRQVVSVGLDGHTRVVDIIFGTEKQFYENCMTKQGRAPIEFSSTKAEELGFQNDIKRIYLTDHLLKLANGNEEERAFYNKLTSDDISKNPNAKSAVEDMQYNIRWLFNQSGTKTYITNGNGLRDWLLSNAKGERVEIGLSVAQTVMTKLATGVSKTLAKTTKEDKRSSGAVAKKTTGKPVQTVKGGGWNDDFYGPNIRAANTKFLKDHDNMGDWEISRDTCVKWKKGMEQSLSTSLNSGNITQSAYSDFLTATRKINSDNEGKYNAFVRKYNSKQKRLNARAIFDKLTGTMTAYGAESTTAVTDTAESSAPATEEEVKTVYEQQLLNHLSYILQLTGENNEPYFITKDMLNSDGNIRKIEDGSRNMTVFDPALEDKTHTEFRIMVEPLDWFTPHNTAGKPVYGQRFYGSLTNLAQAFDEYLINQLSFNNGLSEHLNRNSFNKVSWCAMTVGNSGEDLEKAFNGKFIFDPVPDKVTGAGKTYRIGADIVPNRFLADTSRPYMHEGENRPHQLGWGVQMYWPKPPETAVDKGTTSTWDGKPTPGPSPETPDKTLRPLKVAKWYYTEDETTETVVGVKVQPNSNSPIAIKNEDNETDGTIWEVNGWSTGLADKIPTNDDTSTTYEEYSDSNKGTYAGTDPAILTLEKEDQDKVLYVKLVAKPLSTSKVDIVKVFEKADNSNPTVAVEKDVPLTEGQEYNPTDSRGTYTENIQSEEPSKSISLWDDILDQGFADDGNPIIKTRDTKTIYIHYNGGTSSVPDTDGSDKAQTPLILHEDELSYGYNLKHLRSDGTLAYWQERFDSMSGKVRYCSGHDKERSDGSTYTVYCSYRSRSIDDNFYSLRANLPNSNPSFIADIAEESDSAGIGAWVTSGFKGISGGLTARSYPNANFLLNRDRDKDRATLYPGKNDGDAKSKANKLGITAESYTPAGTRIAKEGTGTLKETFNVNFNDAGTDRTLSWVWRGSRGCTASGSWNSNAGTGHSLADVNAHYTFTNNVRELYELGKPGTGTAVPDTKLESVFASNFKNNQTSKLSQDGEIKFYPYVKMVYNDKDNSTKTPVYVTSENVSTIPAYTKLEAGVWKNNQKDSDAVSGSNPVPNVSIITNLWTTSGNSMIFRQKQGIDDKRVVLNGGAVFDVKMNDVNTGGWGLSIDTPKTSTKLGYRVWSVVVDDAQAGMMASGTTAPTLSDAKQRIEELDKTVKETVPKYGLAQIVSKGIVDYDGYLNNLAMGGNNFSYVPTADATWEDIKLSTDQKYYLKLAGIGTGKEFDDSISNFDLIDGGVEQQAIFKISSDTAGNVTVTQDGKALGTLKATDKDVEKFIGSNTMMKQLDYSTKAITNYVQSIDRNIGTNRAGEQWYNEAFDGITVLMTYMSYDIGYGKSIADGPNNTGIAIPSRTAVLDVRLSGKQDSKSDLYNFDELTANDKVRSTMFVTAKISDTILPGVKNDGYVAPQDPDGYFGTLRLHNGEVWDIVIPDMRCFAYSKMFYIPNATVMDLRSN